MSTNKPTTDPINESILALRVVAMPRETNPYGTIFGGVILSHIDQAGFVEARRHADLDWVTASIEQVDFHAPVRVGDIVNYYSRTVRLGRTSVAVEVQVEAERFHSQRTVKVTSALLNMVGMRDAKPFPFRECPRNDHDE
ncbi:MAG: hypothetical protein JKY96_03175 [Phycisphaerales bacterium]|nr:hypothetical protein [Phycisphaerales bacterium]